MKNIVLIGMPGAGKSTIGVILAKILGYNFIDSDLLIQNKEQQLLHEIITEKGLEGFLAIENEVNRDLVTSHSVISTGGSIIYGKEAMENLKNIGVVVYLQLPYSIISKRLGDIKQRGVVLKEGQDLSGLYAERCPLYEHYADIIISCKNMNTEEVMYLVKRRVEESFERDMN